MNLEAQFILAAGSALVSAAFSAGMAWMSIKMIGSKVDDLKGAVKEVRDEHAVHEVRLEHHGRQIAVIESQVGSLRAMRSPVWRNGQGDGGNKT
jgi:hypothetical protein